MIKNLLLFCLAVVLFSCSNKTPANILPPDKMQNVLWDVMSADVFTTDFISKDSTKKLPVENVKLQKQIFAMHKTTREQFYDSYKYYEQHPAEMQAMLDTMVVRKKRADIKVIDSSKLKKAALAL